MHIKTKVNVIQMITQYKRVVSLPQDTVRDVVFVQFY